MLAGIAVCGICGGPIRLGVPARRRDLGDSGPVSTGALPNQDLSGHVQVTGRVPLHSGSAQVDEHVGNADDLAPVIEEVCRSSLPAARWHRRAGRRSRRRYLVAVGLDGSDWIAVGP